MKPRRKSIFIIISILIGGILIITYLLYSPDIPPGEKFSLPEWIHNSFAYVYHFTKFQWIANRGQDQSGRREAALAAWYRPSRMKQLLKIDQGNYFELGREYASLGLGEKAGYFFKLAFQDIHCDEDRALDIISYLGMLSDWHTVRSFSERLREENPLSSEATYWLGRSLVEIGQSSEAIPLLDKAYELNQSSVDSLYQKARAFEQLREIQKAVNQCEEVTALAPNHRAAWQALDRFNSYEGIRQGSKKNKFMLSKLTPQIHKNLSFENIFVLIGYSIDKKIIFTKDTIKLDIYFQGWRDQPIYVRPEIVFIDETNRKVLRKLETVEIMCQGTVTKKTFNCEIPDYLAPGPIKMMLSFWNPQNNLQVRINNTARQDFILTSLDLNPRWIRPNIKDSLVRQYFGKNARSLHKRTYLAKGSSLYLDLNEKDEISALGVISGIICPSNKRNHLLQGQIIGNILIEAVNGGSISFPIKLGEHTSDIYWDLPNSPAPLHKKAPIFRSGIAKWREPHFMAHLYYAIYRFSSPLKLKSLKIECTGSDLVLHIFDLILIPD